MNIEGINLPSTIVPFTTDDDYATHDEQYGKGGYRAVSTVSEMNAIPSQRRKEGMLVKITSTGDYYTLKNGTFTKESFGSGGSSGGSTDIEYISIDYVTFNELVGNGSTTSSDIINVIGQSNLDRMFSEDGCPIKFANVITQGASAFTKCVLKGNMGGLSIVAIPIEMLNIGYNIMLQNGTYSIEKNTYITFDSVLNGDSMNAPQTRIVYNELATKAGIYRTSFRFGEVEYDWQYSSKSVTSAQQAELQRIRSAIIAGKLVLTNDETGNTFYKGVVNYVTADDSSWISLVITDDRGNPKCFTYDGTASNPEWDIHGVEVKGGNTGNTNIKYLTTPGLFNRSRDEVITLNANDVSIINSLYGKKYRNTKLYYIGSPAGDWGIFPVIAACNAFEEETQIGNAGESIYLSILNEVGVPVSEHLSVDSPTELITGNNAMIPNALFSTASSTGPNGYEKFNDGLMIQWGTSSTSGREFNITLPVSFYNNSYNIQLTMDYLTDNLCEINVGEVQTTSKFTVTTKTLNERGIMEIIDTSFHWVAIGRWK